MWLSTSWFNHTTHHPRLPSTPFYLLHNRVEMHNHPLIHGLRYKWDYSALEWWLISICLDICHLFELLFSMCDVSFYFIFSVFIFFLFQTISCIREAKLICKIRKINLMSRKLLVSRYLNWPCKLTGSYSLCICDL